MPESLLNDRDLIPLFVCEGRDGALFDSQEFRRKRHLVIFFLSMPQSPLFISIQENISKIREKNTELAVVCLVPVGEIGNIYKTNRLTFGIFSDDKREVFSKFVKAEEAQEVAALFIVDKSGAVFFQYVANRFQDLPSPQEIVQSLDFIESQYR